MNNRVLLPIALVLASQSTLLTAAEYVIGAKFSPTFTYDDNVQLREDKEGSFFTRIQPTLVLSRAEANSKITFNTGLSVERYTDLKDLDREDPFANFSAGWNTERSHMVYLPVMLKERSVQLQKKILVILLPMQQLKVLISHQHTVIS